MIDIDFTYYRKIADDIWTGRNDGDAPEVQRWHQRIGPVDLKIQEIPFLPGMQKGIALIGFACDEGVRRNGGRVGAKDGPLSFRKVSGNLPVHFEENLIFIDLGDVVCEDGNMEAAQQVLGKLVGYAICSGYRPMVIGGGHEVAYGHYNGIKQSVKENDRIGIINFDAHFDLREKAGNGFNSGTGFLQIANDCKVADAEFRYLPIGIQRNSNTRMLFQKAEGLGVNCILAEKFQPLNEKELMLQLDEFLAGSTHIYLTICMDVFSSAVAPGVSAAAYSGIFPDPFFFGVLNYIVKSGKLMSMDIAELNPVYDLEARTAKLTAALAFGMVGGAD